MGVKGGRGEVAKQTDARAARVINPFNRKKIQSVVENSVRIHPAAGRDVEHPSEA
jgi:hypothetical protein